MVSPSATATTWPSSVAAQAWETRNASITAHAAILSIRESYAYNMYAIRRMKRAVNAWCWAVDFTRRGRLYSKQFHDQKHGGSEKALAAAIAWCDRALVRARILTHREFCQQKRSNNTSGVPGVHFLRPARQPQGIWQARIKLPDGRKKHKTFSVRRSGYQKSFERAIDARTEMLLMVEDRPYLSHPTAKRFAAKRQTEHAPWK